jgi:hypothetical protein
MHHDCGAVGAAVPDKVLERRLRLAKEIGCNAIRTSHNPMAPELYDLCDRLGLMVMDEAFDEWTGAKHKWIAGWNSGSPSLRGSSEFFDAWAEADLREMVKRDGRRQLRSEETFSGNSREDGAAADQGGARERRLAADHRRAGESAGVERHRSGGSAGRGRLQLPDRAVREGFRSVSQSEIRRQ